MTHMEADAADKTLLAHYQNLYLEFISGKYSGVRYPLPPGTEKIIGRAGNIDLVLDESLVSRRHAMISTKNDVVKVRDLGSTNGTFVNGMIVTEADLAVGDRILIGGSIMRLVMEAERAMPSAGASEETLMKMAAAAGRNTAPSIVQGTLEEIPLPDMIQMLCSNKKKGMLRINGPQKGYIHLNEGSIWDAGIEGRDMPPFKAWCRMLAWESGRFKLEPFNGTAERRMQGSVQALILEGIHQSDEMKSLMTVLPDLDLPLCIPHPLTPLLRDLSPEELDLLQAAHNHRTIDAVLESHATEDFKLCETLAELIQKQYLVPETEG